MMTTKDDDFGKGVFDEENKVQPLREETDDNEPEEITLTDREIAIARGEDPDDTDAARNIQRDNEARNEDEDDSDEDLEDEDLVDDDEDDSDEDLEDDGGDYEWSQSDRRLASQYGLTDEDLQGIPDAKALHTTIDLLERRGAKQQQTDDSSEGDGKETQETETTQDLSGLVKAIDELEELTDEEMEGYSGSDAKLVGIVQSTQKVLKQFKGVVGAMEAMQQQNIEQQQRQVVEAFNDTLDGYADIYGTMKDGKVAKHYQAARDQVREQAEIIFQGYMNSDREVPPLKDIFEQAIRATHSDQLRKKAPTTKQGREARAAKLREQSKTRRSPGKKQATQSRPHEHADPYDPAVIASDPEITDFWEKTQAENGVT